MATLLKALLATAERTAQAAVATISGSGVIWASDTVIELTSANPTTIAVTTAPAVPNFSPATRPTTMIKLSETANPMTDQNPNGLRNCTGCCDWSARPCERRNYAKSDRRRRGCDEGRPDCEQQPRLQRGDDGEYPQKRHRRRDCHARSQEVRWTFTGGRTASIGDRNGRGRSKAAGGRRDQDAAACAEIFRGRIARERYAREHNGDDPYFARVDAAEGSNRIIRHDR